MSVVEQPLSHCPCPQALHEGPALCMARTGVLEEAVDTPGREKFRLPSPSFFRPLPVSSGRSPGHEFLPIPGWCNGEDGTPGRRWPHNESRVSI